MRMSRPVSVGLTALVVAVAVLVVAVSGGSAKKPPRSVPPGSAISVRQTSLGRALVAGNGRSLYLFRGDRRDVSTLSAAGLAVWPALTSSVTPHASGGASAAKIGTVTGSGRRRQLTYNGHPLYFYVGDQKPGDTHGQGLNQFGALWYVLSPSGNAITRASHATATSTTPSTPGYPSGY